MLSGFARFSEVSVSSDSRRTVGLMPSWVRVRIAVAPSANVGKRQVS